LLSDAAEGTQLAVNDDGLFGDACFKKLGKVLGKHGPAKIISLGFVTLVRPEKFQLLLGFHSLGNHAELQAAAHTDYRGHIYRIDEVRTEGWRQRRLGSNVKPQEEGERKADLTLTGLLMEGVGRRTIFSKCRLP